MSGGVDSSVAAALLAEQGHDVVGVFLRNGVDAPVLPGQKPRCCSAGDAGDARQVAAALEAPFYAVDESELFDGLIAQFVDAYAAGRTPNPCVTCNRDVKIASLERVADSLAITPVATGHYARVHRTPDGIAQLRRAVDLDKDQTYFLSGLTQAQIERVRFPLGELTKPQVREAARRFGLLTAEKPESQEICFVAGTSYRDLVAERRPDALVAGEIVDEEGTVLGRHQGIAGFTIGQRRGLGLGGGGVRHVVAIDAATHRVVVGPPEAQDQPWIVADAMRWWGGTPAGPLTARVQIRHRHAAVEAVVEPRGARALIRFSEAVQGAAPGQIAAVYDHPTGEILLGAGTILADHRSGAAMLPEAAADNSR
jgi:tRNA-specific 2-thiouridylase